MRALTLLPLGLHACVAFPVGITGREANVAYARSSTWGVPASVTQQLLLENTTGFDDTPQLVPDQVFNEPYIGVAEVGDRRPPTPTLSGALRFEQGPDTFLAAVIGSPASPVVVSSAAANSLVAYEHVIDMAPDDWAYFTFAADLVQYVNELRTGKIAGFTIRVGTNGVLTVQFPVIADRATYTSSTNTNSTVAEATVATPGNRAFRKNTTIALNDQSVGTLGASDALTLVRDFTLTFRRQLAQDYVANQDYIIEADDDGFLTATLDLNFARCNTVTANSMAMAFAAGQVFKGSIDILGTYINSITQRELLLQMPALQVSSYKAEVNGHGEIRPAVSFALRMAASSPSGMPFTNPLRATITNARSTDLLA